LHAVPIVFIVKAEDAPALGVDGRSIGGRPETIVGNFVVLWLRRCDKG